MRTRLVSGLAGLLGAVALAAPLAAAPDAADIDYSAERAAIGQFQTLDQKLQNVGWKLVRGNVDFCSERVQSVGLQLQDLRSYGEPLIARNALSLGGDFAVQTAARGSPAALSGAFRTNREISGIGALDPTAWPAGERMHWERLEFVHDYIDMELERAGQITVRFPLGEDVTLRSVPVCAARFALIGNADLARGGRGRVSIGAYFPGFAYEEEVFAGVVAHELAHSLLGHSVWLDENQRKRRNVRRTEREADRLMPWLMANAGYDPAAAARFMTRWGKAHDGGLFRARTHDGWDERVEFIEAELPQIRALIASEGKADWSLHFRRDIKPKNKQPATD